MGVIDSSRKYFSWPSLEWEARIQAISYRASDIGCIGIFYAIKMPKNTLGMMSDTYVIFWGKMTPLIRFIQLIMQEYDSKWLKMYLITLKVFKICLKYFAPITKVNDGESNTPCTSTLEVTYSSG
jgi:hypothetical protein